jgi:hypothetical protein
LPSSTELREHYLQLYEAFLKSGAESIREFAQRHSRAYLVAFCRANNLPIDTGKLSKDRVGDSLEQWLVQRKAIEKKAT